MNKDLCQECQEREHCIIQTCDPKTGLDLDQPLFLCSVCDKLKMILNGWVEQENGDWEREQNGPIQLDVI